MTILVSEPIPERVRIVEVGPRDGLQNEAQVISTDAKVELIKGLVSAGLTSIEAGSFVSAKWVPQMANTLDVFRALPSQAGVRFAALTPNVRGLEAAIDAGATEVAVFTAASETFSQKNINCSIMESLARFLPVIRLADEYDIPVRGYVSCTLGCPYEGEISIDKVAEVSAELMEMGCYEVSLGDTVGVGTPLRAQQMIQRVSRKVSVKHLAVHFHDTYGQALANILAALQMGVSVVDSSVGGLGGCPYADGASGNVATEEVVYMLRGLGIETGVDLDRLIDVSTAFCREHNLKQRSRVSLARD
jgi:hydroxymethylglutaryl-CoA lyase